MLMIAVTDELPWWFTKNLGFPSHCLTKYQDTTQQMIHVQAILAIKHYLPKLAIKQYLPKLNPVCLRGLNKVTGSMHI
jgi:hypothetical protein